MPVGKKIVVKYSLKDSCLVQVYNVAAKNT